MSAEDRMREAWLHGAERAPGSPPCIPSERLWEAVHDQLGADELKRVLDHVAGCAACARAWRIAQEIAPAPAATATREQRATRALWPWGLLAAAVVLVFSLIALPVRQATKPVYRDEGTSSIMALTPDGAVLSRQDCVLRWSPGPDGSRYRIEVATAERGVIASRQDLDTEEFRVPAEALEGTAGGTELFWRVTAVTLDGDEHSSVTFIASID